MKRCKQCGEFKPVCEFYSAPTHTDQLTKRCKPCHVFYSSALRRKDVVGALLQGVRSNAKRRNIECRVTRDDVTIPDVCPVFGIPLRKALGRMDDNSPSIDRLDSSKGYTPDNIRIVSWKANRLKNEATLAELERLVVWIRQETNH